MIGKRKAKEQGGTAVAEPRQPKMLDVPRSQATIEAERYGDIQDEIEAKKQMLIQQAEKVMNAMKKASQKVLNFTDQYGFKHTFTVVDGIEKLRHTKREEA